MPWLLEKVDEDAVFWLNGADPASLCGVDVSDLKKRYPERFPSTYLVLHGSNVVIVARKRGAELDIRVTADAPELPGYIEILRSLTRRSFNPLTSFKVRIVNGVEASMSGYGGVLEACGFVKDYQGYSLRTI